MPAKVYPMAKLVYPENIVCGCGVVIDDFAFIVSKGPTQLGDFVHVASFTSITGGGECVVGAYSALSSGVRILTGTEDLSGESLFGAAIPVPYRNPIRSGVKIGKHCLIGANTVILPGAVIPDGVVVGAMSLVLQDSHLQPWSIYAGCPVRRLRTRPKGRVLELEAEYE